MGLSKADCEYWASAAEWSENQAGLLAMNHDPRCAQHGSEAGIKAVLTEVRHVAGSAGILFCDMWSPSQWVAELSKTNIEIPSALREAVNARSVVSKVESPLSESERDKLLRQIGALALAFAAKGGRYARGSKPNATQVALEAREVAAAIPNAETRGLGDTELRESIAAGVKLLAQDDLPRGS